MESGAAAATPTKQVDTGRDEHGRFMPGFCGNPNGRPRAIDLRALAEGQAEARGIDLEAALMDVVEMLLEKARGGCLSSARLLFDKLVTSPADAAKGPLVSIDARPIVAAPMPSDAELLELVEELQRERTEAGQIGMPAIETTTAPATRLLTGSGDSDAPPDDRP